MSSCARRCNSFPRNRTKRPSLTTNRDSFLSMASASSRQPGRLMALLGLVACNHIGRYDRSATVRTTGSARQLSNLLPPSDPSDILDGPSLPQIACPAPFFTIPIGRSIRSRPSATPRSQSMSPALCRPKRRSFVGAERSASVSKRLPIAIRPTQERPAHAIDAPEHPAARSVPPTKRPLRP